MIILRADVLGVKLLDSPTQSSCNHKVEVAREDQRSPFDFAGEGGYSIPMAPSQSRRQISNAPEQVRV